MSKVLKLIRFSVFFILGVAAWGPWAQATPWMKKNRKKNKAKANQATCCQNCFSVFLFILGVAAWGPWAQATLGMKKKQKNNFGNKLKRFGTSRTSGINRIL